MTNAELLEKVARAMVDADCARASICPMTDEGWRKYWTVDGTMEHNPYASAAATAAIAIVLEAAASVAEEEAIGGTAAQRDDYYFIVENIVSAIRAMKEQS